MNSKKVKITGIILFFIILNIIILKNIIDNQSLKRESRYTIGEITGVLANGNSGYRITFDYYVQGNKYSAFDGIYKNNKKLVGKRFYVKFSPNNYKNCKLLLDKPVLLNIKEAPKEGWDNIPE